MIFLFTRCRRTAEELRETIFERQDAPLRHLYTTICLTHLEKYSGMVSKALLSSANARERDLLEEEMVWLTQVLPLSRPAVREPPCSAVCTSFLYPLHRQPASQGGKRQP
jgi:hypothetical protein